jgi:hypothetical protein
LKLLAPQKPLGKSMRKIIRKVREKGLARKEMYEQVIWMVEDK